MSRAASEPLAGTAVHATRWLLVEAPGAWPRDVSDPAALPGAARDAVAEWLERSAPARVLFVRRPGRTTGARLAFAVRADESGGEVRRFELEQPDELATLDLVAGGDAVDTQLVLVCGHGSRDRCCALRGTAVFGALDAYLHDEALWLSSHQGGHRFAGNVLVLPSGIQLGRVDPEDASAATERALAGRIDLDRYRGRVCFPPHVQAAEHAVRAVFGLDRLDALRFDAEEGRVVRFVDDAGRAYRAAVDETEGPAVLASCGARPEPQRMFSVHVG